MGSDKTSESGGGNFEIYFTQTKRIASDIEGQAKTLAATQDELTDIINQMSGSSAILQVRDTVKKIRDDIGIHAKRMDMESQTILNCMYLYESAEADLLGVGLPDDRGSGRGGSGGGGSSQPFTPDTPGKPSQPEDTTSNLPRSGWVEDFDYVGKDGTIYHYKKAYINSDGKVTAYYGKTSWKSSFLDDYKISSGKVVVKQPWEFKNAENKDKNGKPVRKVYQQGVGWINAEKQEGLAKTTLKLMEQQIAGVSGEATLYGAEVSGETSWGSGSASAKFLTAEGSASIGAGVYMVKNPDGSYSTAVGVQASAAASAAVVALSASGFLGSTSTGAGVAGDAGAKVLSANASAAAEMGWIAGKGPQVSLTGSVGANLVEAKASAGVALAKGLSVKATGSVQIGVGATAGIGYSGGKFHCELGVALGLGFKISIDIDIGAVVNKVCDMAKSAYNGFWDVFKKAFPGYEDAINEVKKQVEAPVKNVVEKVVNVVKKIFKKW